MKYITFLSVGLLLLSCESNETKSSHSDLGSDVSKGQYESAQISDTREGISFDVKVLEINDSRCGSDVVCVHAGWATVNFEIKDVPVFVLKIGESIVFSVKGKSFKLTLTDVIPYPSSTNQDDKKEAVFSITKLS